MRTIIRELSVGQIRSFAQEIAEKVTQGFILLDGPIGAGKTTFTQYFLKNYGIEQVTSPTFSYVQNFSSNGRQIFHADLYRVEYATQLRDLGLEFYQDELFLVEWGERFEEYLQPIAAKINIELSSKDPNLRLYTVHLFGSQC